MKPFVVISLFLIIGLALLSFFWHSALWLYLIVVPIVFVGIGDLVQTKHTLKRNFPLIGRMRWWAEWLRPKVYQYFVESDTDGAPYNRLSRNVIYQRAKKVNDTTPFGTQLNVYDSGYEWLNHSSHN
jgi:hypothetical protein